MPFIIMEFIPENTRHSFNAVSTLRRSPVLAGAVGDVEERLSSKYQLEDKDLRLTRYIYMTSLIIV